MAKHDVLIIGGGLYGQVIAKELTRRGRTVTIFDCKKTHTATPASGMLTKTGWFKGLGSDVYDPGLKVLRDNFTVHTLGFDILLPKLHTRTKEVDVLLVEPSEFDFPVQRIEADSLQSMARQGRVIDTEGRKHEAKTVIVAAGIWCNELFERGQIPYVEGRKGISFFWDVKESFQLKGFIELWAPYKHLVGFKYSPTKVWIGDGTALMPQSWTSERELQCLDRCHAPVKGKLPKTKAHAVVGIRPYVRGHKLGVTKEVMNNIWVSTGGAKNGTVGAGYAAHVIAESICK